MKLSSLDFRICLIKALEFRILRHWTFVYYNCSKAKFFDIQIASNYSNQKMQGYLELRKYKNDSTESRCMLVLKLPPFSLTL